MSSTLIRILVVEDEPGIAELLKFTLQAEGFSCEFVSDCAAATQAIGSILPQLVLLDWMLPDRNGISLLQEWRAQPRTASLPVIMLTAKGQDEDKVTGLYSGADDYITKPFSPRELVARIHALLRRRTPELTQSTIHYGIIALNGENHDVVVDGKAVSLDQSEFRLLRYLMTHPNRIFSRTQLLDKVWGDHIFIEERTVDVHIMRLRKALGEKAASYLVTMRGEGYRFGQP